jgi:hypothetical protein
MNCRNNCTADQAAPENVKPLAESDGPAHLPRRVFVNNFPYTTREDELRELFSQVGEIPDLHVLYDAAGRVRDMALIQIFQMPCANVIPEFQYRLYFRLFQMFIIPINLRMLSAASGQMRLIIQQTCVHLMRSQMPIPEGDAVYVFEAIEMESTFVDWLNDPEAVHRNNCRVLFEEGALEPLMQFRARGATSPQSITWLTKRNS